MEDLWREFCELKEENQRLRQETIMMLKADKGDRRSHEQYHIQTNYVYWKAYKLVIDLLLKSKYIFEFSIQNKVKRNKNNHKFYIFMAHIKLSSKIGPYFKVVKLRDSLLWYNLTII